MPQQSNQKHLSNAIRHAFASNRNPQQNYSAMPGAGPAETDAGGIPRGGEPSVYHSHDFRHQAGHNQQSSHQQHRATHVGSSGSPGGKQARDLTGKPPGGHSRQQRNTNVAPLSAYSNQLDRAQRQQAHSKSPNQHQLTQSAQKQQLPSQHAVQPHFKAKGESVSFDQRIHATGATEGIDPQLRQSIEATEASIAYRSVQDQRSAVHSGAQAMGAPSPNWTAANYSS